MKKSGLGRALVLSTVLALSVSLAGEHVQATLLLHQADRHRLEKKYSRAISLYQELAALRPNCALPHIRLGRVYVAQGRWDEAHVEFVQARELDASSAEPLLGLGMVAHQRGDLEAAVDLWRAATSADPRNVEAHNHLGRAYLYSSRPELARQEFDLALLHDKDQQTAHYYLGLLLAAEDPLLSAEHMAIAATGDDGHLAESAQDWVTLLNDFPLSQHETQATARLAHAYVKHGLGNLALPQLERLLVLEPDNHAARAYLGYALYTLDQHDRARTILRDATHLAPKYPLTYYFLGLLHRSDGYLPTALWEFRKCLQLDPYNAATYASIGETYQRIGQYVTAAKWYASAVEVAPEEVEFWLLLAQFYEDVLPRAHEALEAAQQAADLAPDNPIAQELLGWARHLEGDENGAQVALKRSLSLDPDFARAYYHLGVVYSQIGEKDNAQWAYQRAIDLDSDGFYRQRAMVELRTRD